MKNAWKDLRIMALVAGSGAVGVLATLFVLAVIRGPAAAPEPVDARQQAVDELTKRLSEVSDVSARVESEGQRIRVTVPATTAGAAIRIRGSASVGQRAEPVIYIDGVRINGDRDVALQRLEPDQIDRIEVLKGDAAKELYGSEAANGVIQIVTKSKEGS